ncbi:MAG: PIG-L family deacetylase [Candidatus Hydrogenedentes bacterium]|nr:PIG-L family deacetylase [Candidatus Hydrogenedentota bacterium]
MLGRRMLLVLLGSLGLCASLPAEEPLGTIAFRQAQLDLGHDFRLMCVAAHPDDEDGASLAYYRKKYGVKTFAIIATRGEGGQNEIGPELYEELGVIRTKEMLAAAGIEGAQLDFLNLPEFGFSKSAEETLGVWGKETAMRRMVEKLRSFRPHVVITHHGRMKDHGHHQAIGQVLLEAFDTAADPAAFPDLLTPWQVQRLYIRNWEGKEADAAIPISELDPCRGQTYAEIAADALRVHQSQGMGYFIERLLARRPSAFYDLVKAAPDTAGAAHTLDGRLGPLFDGIPLLDGATLDAMAASPAWQLSRNPAAPETLKQTVLAYVAAAPPGTAEQHRDAMRRLAAAATELRLQMKAADTLVVPGQALEVYVEVLDFGTRDATSALLRLTAFGVTLPEERLQVDEQGALTHTFRVTVPELPYTVPQEEHLFAPDFLAPQIGVEALMQCGAAQVPLTGTLHLDIAPAADIRFPDAPWLDRRGARDRALPIDVLVSNRLSGPASAEVTLAAPAGWRVEPRMLALSFSREDEERLARFTLRPPAQTPAGRADFTARVEIPGHPARERASRLESVDVRVPENIHVGVVQSYDDTFVRTLERLQVPHDALRQASFNLESLRQYSSIILDIRAYQERQDLVAQYRVFLDYVAGGGTLLVMYNKTFEWQPAFAPYPLRLSANRVTLEDAPVTLLAPDHPLFHIPNEIGPATWAGWIQERGLYFPVEWDAAYTPLLAVADPGETIPPGSCLVARHGRGIYLYTALGLYRQLRELHPGVLQLFANMLALQGTP